MSKDWLDNFVAESNKIEGIYKTTKKDIEAHEVFLFDGALNPTIESLASFVSKVQPGAKLRDKVGLNVRVGNHIAPEGGPKIRVYLQAILDSIGFNSPYLTHLAYERLHPFTDGNGRSGRVLWLWQMLRDGNRSQAQVLGFLHSFYYQALEHGDKK